MNFFPDTTGTKKIMMKKTLLIVKLPESFMICYHDDTLRIIGFDLDSKIVTVINENQFILVNQEEGKCKLFLATHNHKRTGPIELYFSEIRGHVKQFEKLTLPVKIRPSKDLIMKVISTDIISIPDLVCLP